ncbi:ROK family transcriptional regulator [Yinghuangia soli]|uniref:ROK family transcriptional regulator n=1 Tax=Yinghuangia soli TaxID=2908204 RepID=A0AA41U5K6_9ACTN|nr:ROK family transcriptional regulator [Yinghuangia soli]MCF2530069.1 ROK family transcriptional regulator [Yinghuangia soli]
MAPASPSTARALNDRLALRLLQSEGPLTAGQLKTLTGLSRPTVADLVERLQGSGLIHVVGEAGAARRGPNARVYGIVAEQAYLAGLDVRMDSVEVVVTDLLGTRLAEASAPVAAAADTETAAHEAVALVERAAREAGVTRLHSIGIGAPGLIDPATGDLRDSSSLPAWHRRLVTVLQERLPAAIQVENETNLAALAEQRLGAARGFETFVMIWLSFGIGAAVVLDGKIRRGASGGAGELGFLPVPGTGGLPSKDSCDGGFNSLAWSPGAVRLAAEYGLSPAPDDGELPGAALIRTAVAAVAAGADGTPEDAFLDAYADRVALGAAAVAAVLDPGCVVLGGEIGRAGGAELARRVQDRLTRLSPLHTEVRATELGGQAVLRGALLAAQQSAQDALFPTGT